MTTKTLLAAVAIAAVPAFASAQSAADQQLAASLGVSASEFTSHELARLKSAKSDNDRKEVEFILSHQGGQPSNTSAGAAALAASAGVEPGTLDVNQLARLRVAREDNDFNEVHAILTGATSNSTSAYKTQLARSLNVDADDYTVADLVRLRKSIED
ncbi:hypothetical protein EKE94_15450 [Mesobaculum littorinae]|uniref:DUF4168 domain-containing protein n=1 Tax=Mesobaculum littorinae TaxID=2486419 RepID=A0A438AEL7_9RHOB|nr:hypothetical protein [Mesobaculum littorinae]RVV97055.1 hypothetical protein EKE94_15450 [Mesobaculum littorinae]